MKPRNPRQSFDHHEIVDYFNRVGAVCCPTREEGFETANRMIKSRQAFRRTLLSSPTVLAKCLHLLTRAANKDVRYDFVFNLSQRESGRINRIRTSIFEVISNITCVLENRELFCDTHRHNDESVLALLIDQIECLDIRIGHLNTWHLDLQTIVKEGLASKPTANSPSENVNECDLHCILMANQKTLQRCKPDYDSYLAAKHVIARGAMKLVVSIAKRYSNPRLPLMDLVQEGNCGLLVAIEKYNPQLGFAFTTYATRWIQQRVLVAVFEKSRTVRLPIFLSRKLADTERELESMAHANAHFPNQDESQQAAKRQKVVERLLQIYRNSFVSIHGLKDSGSGELRKLELENKSLESPNKTLHRRRVIEDVRLAIKSLDSQKRIAIEMRFGLYGEPCSNQRIGDRLGISRETVRTLVKESIKTLQIDLTHLGESLVPEQV